MEQEGKGQQQSGRGQEEGGSCSPRQWEMLLGQEDPQGRHKQNQCARVCRTLLAQLHAEPPGNVLNSKARVCFPWGQDWHQRFVILFFCTCRFQCRLGRNTKRSHVAITELPPRATVCTSHLGPLQETCIATALTALTCAFHSVPFCQCSHVTSFQGRP